MEKLDSVGTVQNRHPGCWVASDFTWPLSLCQDNGQDTMLSI